MKRYPRWLRTILTDDDLEAILRAVSAAEAASSGEIRVHLERSVRRPFRHERLDALGRAREVFAHLGMHRTALRSGVLIYLAVEDRKVAIVGDDGIHTHIGDGGWARIRDLMVEKLRRGEARAAVVEAITEVGHVLARHFPREPGDTNELSDEVSVE